jgi:thymidylate synthase (FAD)
MNKIIVKLNPDTPPTGTDLSVVNAARRSFNTRSDWDFKLSHWKDGPSREELESQGYEEYDEGTSGVVFYKLKDKDKRLIEFLARGMTTDDFEQFKLNAGGKGLDWLYYMDNNKEQELIDLLWQWRNTPTHDTPFNHTFISFEVKLPMFTARQLVKTEYTLISEISRRYIIDDLEFYEHEYRNQSKDKKQGSEGSHVNSGKWEALSRENAVRCVELYNKMINDGVAIEQARGELPANLMVEWTWSGTLGAMAKMCRERMGSDAQKEAQIVAQEVYKHLKAQWPVSAPALVEGVL